MKCILLSAGYGSRLGDLTKNTPKCLLEVNRKSMLEHWFYLFKLYNVTDVLINTHYLADRILSGCSKLITNGINITFTYERELLGTAKTVYLNKEFVKDTRYFLIAFADTWMQVDLKAMLKFQKKRKGMGTLGLYKPHSFGDQGSVKVDGRKILEIEEKAIKPKGQYAYAGVMVGSEAMFKFYTPTMSNLVRDWLPVIKDGLNPYFIEGFVMDMGTPERYIETNKKVAELGLKAL